MHSPIIHSQKDSRRSDDSQDSRSTAPTSLYSSAGLSLYPPTERLVYTKPYDVSPATTYYPRSSTETYLSGASEEDLCEEPDEYDHEYDVPELRVRDEVNMDLRPSTPQDFAELFASSKRLYIKHDDTTYDGNMNLRVDTEDPFGGPKASIQLFHMRMHDLKKREFSLRRYERASGREICHSSRKYKSTSDRRPGLARSMSNAFASITGGNKFKRTNSGLSTHAMHSANPIKRQDSGYGSSQDDEEDSEPKPVDQVPTNTIKLEFSNYAVVEVKRRGAKSSKRYEFEYWGHTYCWKRVIEQDGEGKAVSYHLHKDDGHIVAHIVPEMRSPSQIRSQAVAGGWVPPCSMWVSEHSFMEASTDVADVIVATGLVALADDCIKRHFHPEAVQTHHHQVNVPLTPLKIDLVGPKAMAEHVFKRRGSASSNKEKEHKGSPLKFESPVVGIHVGAY